MCETPEKLRYLTLREAAQAALDQLHQYGPLRPYRDTACGTFHLTTRGVTAEQVRALAAALGIREEG